ncbi:oligosaccharide flippase family protein [Aliarcobacter butzleri]|uniref:lipopolysaccharide biosynthesis protein n=1 Tax=Aliarcobacter butzleri TaxID=28197 RepID=UPI0021B37B4D|nr:oligosaccharide flippase family protein [Aliarcobacter butzleri]MCT7548148.1 oligosaccharide flippase family protein [Aliarcobacter butzleri]
MEIIKRQSDFTKNILTLMTGTAIAQAIPIAISPILTRLYRPEDFGVFALFVAIISVLANTANGRYELAIILPKKDEDAINIFALGFIITCFISLLLLLLVLLFNDYFVKLLGNVEMAFWLYFIPITVFFSGLYNILNYFNNRRKDYKDLRNAAILKSIVLAVIQISVGLIKQGATGLISGQIVSNLFANIKLLNNILKDKVLISKISMAKMIALAKKYKKFPKYSLPSTFVDDLTLQMNSLLLPKVFNLTVSGYFFLAQKIVNMPASLIANSVSQVYFQKLSDNKNKRILSFGFFLATVKKLFLIALPLAIIIYLFSPFMFSLIFGEQWRVSGEIAQYLAWIFLIRFIVSPLSISFSVSMEVQKSALWKYMYFISTSFLFLFITFFNISFDTFLVFFLWHEIVLYLLYFYMITKTVKKIDSDILNLRKNKLCVE